MTNYSRGAAYEREVMEHMRLQGASFALRSSGSHGPVDVAGFFPYHSRIIQVTTEGQPVQPRLAALADLEVANDVTKEVWVRGRASWCIYVADDRSEAAVLDALRAAQGVGWPSPEGQEGN